jgi:hypothetical protein
MPVKKNKPFQIPLDVPVSEPHSQTHYLAPDPVVEVAPVPEELELNKNYETDIDFANKLLSLDFKPVKKSKPRKPKKVEPVVVEPVVVEPVKKTRKPKKVVEVITDYAQPAKATKKSNPWIDHIKKFSVDNGLTYNKSMLDPRLKESYVKSTGTKGKVSLG